MGKKVLVISCSPRKHGNSDTLCDQFMKGAVDAGHSAEKIYFSEKKIAYCTGCGVCFEKQKCSQNDDMAEILEKLIACDVLVLATPVYFYCMDAQMKTFIDRTTPRYKEMKNKDIYFILTAADSGKEAMDGTLAGLRGFTSLLPGAKEKNIIFGVSLWDTGDAKKSPLFTEAHEMGKSI
jgi:multimeric flavodoxin WrbA